LAAVWLADVCVCVCTYAGNCTYVMYPYISIYTFLVIYLHICFNMDR
jgi:hypothetical protein